MSIRLPSHLYRNRHGVFYFRFVIPKDLQRQAGQSEIRISLNTEQRHQAIMLATPLIAALPELTSELRRMSDNEIKISTQSLTRLKEDLRIRFRQDERIDELQNDVFELRKQLIQAQNELAQSIPKPDAVRRIKGAHTLGQLTGRKDVDKAHGFGRKPEDTPLFSQLKDSYLNALTNNRAEGGNKKPPTQGTLDDYNANIYLFIEVMGDVNIGAIDEEMVGKYFATLKRLPAHIKSAKEYRKKTINEILSITPPPPPQTEANCSKKIERISTMFKWAIDPKRRRTWGIDVNPFTGYGQSSDVEATRRAFTDEELRALLNHPHFKARSFTANYMYWLIPLALYTGARLGEITLLDLKDFIVEEGVPCIDINDVDAVQSIQDGRVKKRVKTNNAKRLVPIHSELIRLGILRFVEGQKEKGEVHLFPEMSRMRKRGPRDTATTWFIGFRKKVGITSKQEVVFHSFRNTFITRTLNKGWAPHLIAPIVGHQANLGITGNVYWNKRDATERKPTLEAFTLPDDLTQLIPTYEEIKLTAPRGPKPGRKQSLKAEASTATN